MEFSGKAMINMIKAHKRYKSDQTLADNSGVRLGTILNIKTAGNPTMRTLMALSSGTGINLQTMISWGLDETYGGDK